ncbi:hypothetical protein EV121DRAFT_193431 [Schizophyllum commune]
MTTNLNADAVYRPLGAYDIRVLRFIMLQIAIDLGLYGVQVTLSIAAIAILARREGRSRSTLAAIMGIVLSSTIIVVANYTFWLIQIPTSVGTSQRPIDDLLLTLNILTSVARNSIYVLGDAVLVWRAWCLWPDNRLVRGILSLCVCSTVGDVAECVWLYWPGSPTFSAFEGFAQYLARLVPLLTTNVIATAMIGIWVCRYRREIKGSLGVLTQKTRSERVLMLLLESGLVYCLFWVYICTMFFVVKDDDGFSAKDAFGDAAYHISGIYPTCVLFVSMQDKPKHSLLSAQMSQAMHFASAADPREGPRAAGMASDSQAGRIDSPHDIRLQTSLSDGLLGSSVAHDCIEAPPPGPDKGVFEKLEGESASV